MENISQSKEFIYFYLIGMLVSLIFDIFRSIRKNFKTSDKLTYIEDSIFLIIATTIIMIAIFKFSKGIIRFYILFAIISGIVLYTLTFSKFCIIIIDRIIVFIINFFKKIIILIKKLGKKTQL